MNPAPPCNSLRKRYNQDAFAKGGELCYSSASLVDETSKARRHNKNNYTLFKITNYITKGGAG